MEKIICERAYKEKVSIVEEIETPKYQHREIMIFPHEVQFFLNQGKRVYKREREVRGEIKVFYFVRVFINDLINITING
jgi:predicted GNAT family acetyltransferase